MWTSFSRPKWPKKSRSDLDVRYLSPTEGLKAVKCKRLLDVSKVLYFDGTYYRHTLDINYRTFNRRKIMTCLSRLNWSKKLRHDLDVRYMSTTQRLTNVEYKRILKVVSKSCKFNKTKYSRLHDVYSVYYMFIPVLGLARKIL